MVLADDEKREYGDVEDALEDAAECEALGIKTISMKDDFKTIFGDGVEKTELK